MRIGFLRGHTRPLGLAILCACSSAVRAQLTPATPTTSTTSTQDAPAVERTLQGHVVNANDGSPIPRVLVTINGRSVLTASQGQFQFPGFTDTQASVTLTKPGYSQSDDPMLPSGNARLANLDAPAELKLYPDAVITGTVTGSDGLPLTGVAVTLRRAGFTAAGFAWAGIRTTQTDSHGEYRFREPAGRFQLSVSFVAHARDTGEIVLPVTFPDPSESETLSVFEARSGEEKHIDLRPRTGPGFAIPVRVDAPDAQRGVQFWASTSSGESFLIPNSGQSQQGFQLTLPRGSYTLHARLDNRDSSSEGSVRVNVVGDRTDPVVLHLQSAASIPVELALDPASTTVATATSSVTQVTAPDVRQFNLRLHSLSNTAVFNPDIVVRQTDNKGYEFRVPPGRYRLDSNFTSGWYIESASYGNSNLMTSDIALSSGGSGFPVRILVNNVFGMVTGTIKMPAPTGSTAETVWLYLIPRTPTVAPLNPQSVPNTGAGTATFSTKLPVGSYLAAAFTHRIQADLRDPDVISRFSTAARPFDISASSQVTLDLDVSQQTEFTK